MIVPLSPLEFKRRAARLFGSKVGVVDGAQRFTYVDFAARCNRLATGLLALGLRRGERVAVLAPNSHPLLEAYYGVVMRMALLSPMRIHTCWPVWRTPASMASSARATGGKRPSGSRLDFSRTHATHAATLG